MEKRIQQEEGHSTLDIIVPLKKINLLQAIGLVGISGSKKYNMYFA